MLSVEYNVFAGMCKNYVLMFILVVIILTQLTLVQFGGAAVKCSPLSMSQHCLCLVLGVLSLPTGYVAKSGLNSIIGLLRMVPLNCFCFRIIVAR